MKLFDFRVFWILCTFTSFILCGSLIHELIQKYLEKKIFIEISNNQKHVSEIFHPAVAFCFEVYRNFDGLYYQDFVEKANEDDIKALTEEQLKFLQVVELVYGGTFMERQNLSASTDTLLEDLKKFTPWHLFESDYIYMTWTFDYDVPLAFMFTEFGYCLDFNIMTHENLFHKEK